MKRFAILSRNRNLHSIQRLLKEASAAKIECDVINPLECQLVVSGQETRLISPTPLRRYDAVLCRIGASITGYGLAVVRHFEALGFLTVNSSEAIADSRDKMRSLQRLARSSIQVPPTVLAHSPQGLREAVEAVGGMPVVLKVLEGTQGRGVMLVHSRVSLKSVHETLKSLGQEVLIQRFIAEGARRDYRAFVVGNRIVAAMVRTAPRGDFRSNIHRGGRGTAIRLPREFQRAALRAAKVLGLEVAGVDLMESSDGPVVLEVNSSPGFEGIEAVTGINIARKILERVRHLTLP